MIELSEYLDAVRSQLKIDIFYDINQDEASNSQFMAINTQSNESLFIIAGPGSGKTTVMTLRVLKLIFVDKVDPKYILVTTFTRKAAAELSSRILGWGDQIKQCFLAKYRNNTILYNDLELIDFNQITVGTLDSISERILTINREPGNPSPIIIKEFTSKSILTQCLLHDRRDKNEDLRHYLNFLLGRGPNDRRLNFAEMVEKILTIYQRCSQDQVDFSQYVEKTSHAGAKVLNEILEEYQSKLNEKNLFDFSKLEAGLLSLLLKNRQFDDFLQNLKIVIIDEYQDTNFIQAQIYFEFAKIALKNGGSLSVVGDDDQSIYRFRGATVELFRNFYEHFSNRFKKQPKIIRLRNNYRSTENIVSFINEYIQLDSEYQKVRVSNKPPILSSRNSQRYINYPVFGLFRENLDELAKDIAKLIHLLYIHNSVSISCEKGQCQIELNPTQGSAADLCVLCSSAKECDYNDDPRLPLLLKNELENFSPKIKVFNPSGKKLGQIPQIMQLCGLILECIDPDSTVQNETQNFPSKAQILFTEWRDNARQFILSNPHGLRKLELSKFVNFWQNRKKLSDNKPIKEQNVSLIDLSYNIVTWIPYLMEDIEGLAYFESILQTMEDNILFSEYKSEIFVDSKKPFSRYQKATIREAYWNIFVPIALGAIEVPDDLFETLPHDRLNIMSIHQAKGLEFPLVIVDVGSEFRSLHPNNAFKRYPGTPSFDTILESELRPFSQLENQLHIGSFSPRTMDRDFDELIRKFFVAYSRPQDILLLVGLTSVKDGYYLKSGAKREICNIATGWNRKSSWIWGCGLSNLTHIE